MKSIHIYRLSNEYVTVIHCGTTGWFNYKQRMLNLQPNMRPVLIRQRKLAVCSGAIGMEKRPSFGSIVSVYCAVAFYVHEG